MAAVHFFFNVYYDASYEVIENQHFQSTLLGERV